MVWVSRHRIDPELLTGLDFKNRRQRPVEEPEVNSLRGGF
jgi:hypothetical protein